jgi:hypothetical protein
LSKEPCGIRQSLAGRADLNEREFMTFREGAKSRMEPTFVVEFGSQRFDISGNALDPRGLPCQELACPQCHLSLPRASLEISPLFTSIAGSPACGKSYFLASMTWRLRQILPEKFAMTFGDADLVA